MRAIELEFQIGESFIFDMDDRNALQRKKLETT